MEKREAIFKKTWPTVLCVRKRCICTALWCLWFAQVHFSSFNSRDNSNGQILSLKLRQDNNTWTWTLRSSLFARAASVLLAFWRPSFCKAQSSEDLSPPLARGELTAPQEKPGNWDLFLPPKTNLKFHHEFLRYTALYGRLRIALSPGLVAQLVRTSA